MVAGAGDIAKSVGLAPVRLMAMPVSAAPPVFDRVTGSAVAVLPTVVLTKARGFGLRVATGTSGAVPVPVRVAVWGDPVALSETLMAAVKLAAEVGVKVTMRVQFRPMPSDALHPLVKAKLDAFAPVTV